MPKWNHASDRSCEKMAASRRYLSKIKLGEWMIKQLHWTGYRKISRFVSVYNWSAPHWQNTIFCSTSSNNSSFIYFPLLWFQWTLKLLPMRCWGPTMLTAVLTALLICTLMTKWYVMPKSMLKTSPSKEFWNISQVKYLPKKVLVKTSECPVHLFEMGLWVTAR